MAYGSSASDSGGVDFRDVFFRHMDRISDEIRHLFKRSASTPNSVSLQCFQAMVQHLETLLVPFLDDPYYAKVHRMSIDPETGMYVTDKSLAPGFVEKIDDTNPGTYDRYFAISRWMQVLMITANNQKILNLKRNFGQKEFLLEDD